MIVGSSHVLSVNCFVYRCIVVARYNVSVTTAKPYTSIIHAMWKTSEIPERWSTSANSWPKENENFVYCLWNDTELEAFVADEYPWLLSTYLAYPYVIQRCDAARYLLLYHYGGTYADLDLVCLSSMSTIFADAPVDAGVLVAPTEPVGVSNDFIAVRRPRDRVIRGVISGLRRAAASYWYPPLPYAAVMFRTGPVYFTRRLNCGGGERGVHIIPASTYYNIYIANVKGGSWHQWDGWILWKLFLLVVRLYRHPVRLALSVTALLAFMCIVRNHRLVVVALLSRCIPHFSGKHAVTRIPSRSYI